VNETPEWNTGATADRPHGARTGNSWLTFRRNVSSPLPEALETSRAASLSLPRADNIRRDSELSVQGR